MGHQSSHKIARGLTLLDSVFKTVIPVSAPSADVLIGAEMGPGKKKRKKLSSKSVGNFFAAVKGRRSQSDVTPNSVADGNSKPKRKTSTSNRFSTNFRSLFRKSSNSKSKKLPYSNRSLPQNTTSPETEHLSLTESKKGYMPPESWGISRIPELAELYREVKKDNKPNSSLRISFDKVNKYLSGAGVTFGTKPKTYEMLRMTKDDLNQFHESLVNWINKKEKEQKLDLGMNNKADIARDLLLSFDPILIDDSSIEEVVERLITIKGDISKLTVEFSKENGYMVALVKYDGSVCIRMSHIQNVQMQFGWQLNYYLPTSPDSSTIVIRGAMSPTGVIDNYLASFFERISNPTSEKQLPTKEIPDLIDLAITALGPAIIKIDDFENSENTNIINDKKNEIRDPKCNKNDIKPRIENNTQCEEL